MIDPLPSGSRRVVDASVVPSSGYPVSGLIRPPETFGSTVSSACPSCVSLVRELDSVSHSSWCCERADRVKRVKFAFYDLDGLESSGSCEHPQKAERSTADHEQTEDEETEIKYDQ